MTSRLCCESIKERTHEEIKKTHLVQQDRALKGIAGHIQSDEKQGPTTKTTQKSCDSKLEI